MIDKRCIAPIVAAIALAGCQTTAETSDGALGTAVLQSADGRTVGSARLVETGDGVTVEATLTGISPGTHAVHLHTTGACQAPEFTSAGGHLNPGRHQHGALNPQGAHLGDLPNAEIAANGTGSISKLLPGSRSEVLGHIFDTDGTAIIVHAGPDDYKTDPTGNAGGRVASMHCSVSRVCAPTHGKLACW